MSATMTEDKVTTDTMPDTLTAALKASLLVASKDDTLPALCGVALQLHEDGGVATAATDRYKLLLTGPVWEEGNVTRLVARQDVDDIVRWLGREKAPVTVTAGEFDLTVASGVNKRAVTVPLDTAAQFPKVSALIPDETESLGDVAFGTGHLAVVPKVADLLSHERAGAAVVKFAPNGTRPTVITPGGEPTVPWKMLLMPVRLAS